MHSAQQVGTREHDRLASGIALEVRDLSFQYDLKSVRALDGVSLSVLEGEIFGLLGPNGGGKTTLFRVLSTAVAPSTGTATIFGQDILRDPARARLAIGVIFQSPSLDKKLTVRENLVHQGHLYGLYGKDLDEKITTMLQRTGMTERASELVETLSGGLQRRVEIAKGVLHKPRLLLMDEPTTGLDPGARRDFWDYIQELKGEGITIVVTTHLMEEAEKCDRIGILSGGRLVAMDRPSVLKEEIGGDVITVETKDPQGLSEQIQRKFGLRSMTVDGTVRIEREKGHEFVPELVQAFPREILSITVSKPTLEDVFVHRTGHRFWKENGLLKVTPGVNP